MADYYLGHSQVELDRLMAEAVVLRPITERLLLKAGLRPGMRVLDLGCGGGDVTLLLAERVGPAGFVVGVDIAQKAVDLARRRADEAGIDNVVFHLAADPEIETEPFDMVVGRYVVLHQEDPVAFLRAAAERLARGGILAFHEIDMDTAFTTMPQVPSFDAATAEFMAAIRNGAPTANGAARLISLFVAAGLPMPKLFCERPAGGDLDSPLFRWCAACFVALRALTRPADAPVSVDAVEVAFRDAVTAAQAQILGPDQVCAWVRV